ncbi:MAG: hypothetical protein RI995_1519 [Bacteroidota bacterium]|jgi:hypothetical protein
MNIQYVIDQLKNGNSKGLQIEKRNGILTSTWLIYKKKDKYYYFDINQKIEFIDAYGYTESELLAEFANARYTIEEIIN